jgi:hypothetical protein
MRGHPPRKTRGTGGTPPPVPQLHALHLQGLARPILLPEDPDLIRQLRLCLQGWPARLTPVDPKRPPTPPPMSIIEPRKAGRYRTHSCFLDDPIDNLPAATAICAVLADVTQAYSESSGPHVFGLHCGGVSLGPHTLILAGERRAGKSTLVSRLSAEPGVTVLCDDVLPVAADGRAFGLGVAPRLRLPLPDGASAAFRNHVSRWLGPADDRYGYLLAPNLAPHGTSAQASVFLLLDRRPDAAAALHDLPPDQVLTHILHRSIAGPDGPDPSFAAARALSSRLIGLRLVYSDLEQAVDLLARAFPAKPGTTLPAIPARPPLDTPPQGAPDAPPVDPATRFRRSPGTAARNFGEAAFLWQPGDTMLWHLNPVARAIWLLLQRPASANDLALTLAEVYPDQPADRLLSDVSLLLAGLSAEGMIVEAVPAAKREPKIKMPDTTH